MVRSHSFTWFLYSGSLFCTQDEQGSVMKKLLNVLSSPCSLQGSVPDLLLTIQNSTRSTELLMWAFLWQSEVFKRHQWIHFHNLPVRWGYIISTSQMESWNRDKKIKKNDLWLRNSLTSFGLLSFFLIIYHTGCPEQDFNSLSANKVSALLQLRLAVLSLAAACLELL